MKIADAADLWSQAVERLRAEIGEENADLWLKPAEAVSLEGGVLTLRVPNKFFSDGIKERYQKKLLAAFRDVAGSEVGLDFRVERDLTRVLPPSDPVPEASPQSDFALSDLNPRYTFEAFVIGESNRLARATAESIAKSPGTQYNPYVIYGGVGLGKTHLMHAIGNAMRRQHPKARVLYTTSEQFVNEYIGAVQNNALEAFRARYRSLDCLLIDDIQFLIAKERSEQEFFHTFNALFDSRKQIVVSSDRSPKEMTPLEQRLISRLEWGFVADIKPPDLETRIAILRKKADLEGFSVPDDVILFVASSVKTNVRSLEGSLIRLKAFQSMTGAPLTVDDARDILKDAISTDDVNPVRIETIQRVVALKYSVDVKDLKGQQRTASIALPRQVAMYLSCVMSELSSTDIGRAFGGKDHSTVLHARKKIEKKIEEDPFFLELINRIQADIKAAER
ncbi:MAG TPA: chromosomal replication initiator protein DnaA [Elusimicrobiota bacterium]|nr:chromosomal replication initiator protein DnaA [Elusimicrobiota bacterium]